MLDNKTISSSEAIQVQANDQQNSWIKNLDVANTKTDAQHTKFAVKYMPEPEVVL
mgnify:CR=1 FL=1